MGDVLGDALDLVHQPLDFVQHAVDDPNQPVEVAALPAARETLAQIAIDDALNRTRDPIDATECSRAGERCTREPQRKNDQRARSHCTEQQVCEVTNFARVLCDEQGVAGRQAVQNAAKRHRFIAP